MAERRVGALRTRHRAVVVLIDILPEGKGAAPGENVFNRRRTHHFKRVGLPRLGEDFGKKVLRTEAFLTILNMAFLSKDSL